MKRSGKTLAELLEGVTLFPQKLINVRMSRAPTGRAATRSSKRDRAAEAALEGHGRVLIRASGTEPVLRVMVEARA